MSFILNWLMSAAALWVATQVVPGASVDDTQTLFVAALVIGLVNAIIRPILALVTFPITVITLGLFYFVLNGAMFYLAASLVSGFVVSGLGSAIFAAIIMSLVATALHLLVKPGKEE